ncbi:glycosyltransferase family 4 protein [Vibrio breoganii]
MIAKKGNIGYRIDKIPRTDNDFIYTCFARGGSSKNYHYLSTMGPFGHLCRILGAIRRYIFKNFKHRIYDKALFEYFYFLNRLFISKFNRESKFRIAHVVEFSPMIIKRLKKEGYQVILDVPIGPSRYMLDLIEEVGKEVSDIGAYYMKDIEEESFLLADQIIVPSKFVLNELIKCGVEQNKINLIPFGIDRTNGYLRKPDDKTEGIDFVFAGVISTRKGIRYLLEAWSDKRFSKDRLHLCGSITPEATSLIKSLGLTNIILPGFIDTKEYFKKCDVYVFPSLLEGSSKSVYEAMNSSLAVITTIESGSIIKDQFDGLIVAKCDAKALVTKMLEFKFDPKYRYKCAKSGYETVQNYSWDNYSSKVNELYGRLNRNGE